MAEKYSIARYQVNQLHPGLELGETVFSADGGILLYAGTILTQKHIDRILTYGVEAVRIRRTIESGEVVEGYPETDEDSEEDIPVEYCEPDIPEGAQEQENDFLHIYNTALKDLKRCFTLVKLEKHLDCDLLNEIVDSLLQLSMRGISATALLHTTNRSEDYLFHHSVNVGILANVIGTLSGTIQPSQQRNLVMAGVLHDIGKLEIPVQVLYKTEQLTEEEFNLVRQHPAFAFKFFRNFKEIPDSVRYGVLQHHERDDASGYPLKTNGSKNHLFAKIIGIADVYDAMTSKKVYGQEVSPFAAIETIQSDSFSGKFSPQYTTPFLQELCETLIGRFVTLNDGRTGQLVFWNRSGKESCLIRFSDGKILDIGGHRKIKITKLVC